MKNNKRIVATGADVRAMMLVRLTAEACLGRRAEFAHITLNCRDGFTNSQRTVDAKGAVITEDGKLHPVSMTIYLDKFCGQWQADNDGPSKSNRHSVTLDDQQFSVSYSYYEQHDKPAGIFPTVYVDDHPMAPKGHQFLWTFEGKKSTRIPIIA